MADAGDSRELVLANVEDTGDLGARLATLLSAGDVVCLSGPLGAGKTTLARGVIMAWTGVAQDAPSPTFTLVQTYDGAKGELWHADLYRLKGAEEVFELGLVDAFAYAACLIEWPERLGRLAPANRIDIALAFNGEGRTAQVRGYGAWKHRLDAL